MNAPLIWIIIPGGLAAVLLLLRRWEALTAALGVSLALLLAGLAWLQPIGELYQLGPLGFKIGDTLTVLGRRFVLGPLDAPALVTIYFSVAFWSGGAVIARVNRLFVPIGLGIAALLTAVLAVQPFLYAPLFILMTALVCVPLLVQMGQPISPGVLRFLTFQTLGMPFILFTGWILETVEANPAAPVSLSHAGLLLALGFAFFLGIFPFHTWMPMLAEQAHPYVVAFVFFVLNLVIPLFGLGLLDTYAGLRMSEALAPVLRLAGVLMVVTGGVWAAFQRHLARMLGYGMLVQIGFSLLAASLALGPDGNPALLGVMFMLLAPRGLGLAVWALALATIAVHQPAGIDDLELLRFRHVQGAARRLPVAASGLLLAQFSLAGFPLLASFPALLILWQEFSAQSFPLAAAAFVGSLGLFVGGLRALAVLVMGADDQPWLTTETWSERLLLVAGGIGLLLLGLFPNAFLPALAGMTEIFTNLMK